MVPAKRPYIELLDQKLYEVLQCDTARRQMSPLQHWDDVPCPRADMHMGTACSGLGMVVVRDDSRSNSSAMA